MNEEEKFWYKISFPYERGYKDRYIAYPDGFSYEDIEDDIEMILRHEFHWKRRLSWEVEKVERPPDEWIDEQIKTLEKRIVSSRRRIEELFLLKGGRDG